MLLYISHIIILFFLLYYSNNNLVKKFNDSEVNFA
jgi:hypothetical protein